MCCDDQRTGHGEIDYRDARPHGNCTAEGTTPLWIRAMIFDRNGGTWTDTCTQSDHSSAAEMCAADNARLCTRDELAHGCASNLQCGHKHDFLWSGTPCEITAADAVKVAKTLIISANEFHTSADNTVSDGALRPPVESPPNLGRPYKATVVVYLNGGLDRCFIS